MLRQIYSLFITIVLTFIFASLAIIFSFVPGLTVNHIYAFGYWWATLLLKFGGVKLKVIGLEKTDYSKPTVVMCTHRSHFDILALMSSTTHPVSFIAKKELRKLPFFGYSLDRLGMVYLDRSSKEAAIQSLNEAANQVKQGRVVVMFPEGTRSEDGKSLQPLKKGGFHLVKQSEGHIQPVAILGSEKALKKNSLSITPTTITIKYGDPILTSNKDNIEDLMERTRVALEFLLKEE